MWFKVIYICLDVIDAIQAPIYFALALFMATGEGMFLD
jgi:hypothetical protein